MLKITEMKEIGKAKTKWNEIPISSDLDTKIPRITPIGSFGIGVLF